MQIIYNNIIELFEHIVQQYSNRVAIKDYKSAFTYKELYYYSSEVSKFLKDRNTQTGERIVCISKKNTESLICFWGIIFSGCVPVMLDHEDGVAVNARKIETIQAKYIILDKYNLRLPKELEPIGIDFSDIITSGVVPDHFPVGKHSGFSDLCYILLTSGTTGLPKAVQVTQHGVLHYMYGMFQKLNTSSFINTGHVTTFAADLGMTNLLMALLSGGMLRIFNKEEATDPAIFNEILVKDQINFLKMTPSHLISLIWNTNGYYKPIIDNLVLGGEKLSWSTVENVLELDFCKNLYNHYGPTETTIGATAFKIEKSSKYFSQTGSVPIGAALGNGICLLHNKKNQVGELFIAGPGLSKGYFQNEIENEDRFVEVEHNGELIRCYKTGDLCKELEDGNFEFLYRKDRQVKIRGYRIELGEIEEVLISHPDIESVIVVASDKKSQTHLDAYVKPKKGIELTSVNLKFWLINKLPDYKIPSAIFFYQEPPYNANGKIDINSLVKSFEQDRPPYHNDLLISSEESWLVHAENAWKSILNMLFISPDSNFFEIGGDSLMAIQVIGRLQRHGYKVHITDLSRNPVFSDFLAINSQKVINIEPQNDRSDDGLTMSQRLFLDQKRNSFNQYCQSVLLESERKIDIRKFALAINCIIKSHSQLTRVFSFENANTLDIAISNGFGTTVLDEYESTVLQIQRVAADLLRTISIENGRLFIAHLFIDSKGVEYILLLCHHLVIDVISWNIIIEELTEYYDKLVNNLSPVIFLENAVNSFYCKNPEKYFRDDLNPSIQELYRLPLLRDYKEKNCTVQTCSFIVLAELAEALNQIGETKDSANISGFLLNALSSALFEEFGLNKISIDIEFHGRPQIENLNDISRSVAWWSTTLPLNLNIEHIDPDYCSKLLNVKAEYANNINLAASEKIDRSWAVSDVRFNYLGHFPEKFENGSISLRPSTFNSGPNRDEYSQCEYHMFFTSRFIGPRLIVDVQYQTNLSANFNIETFLNKFHFFLKESLKNKVKTGTTSFPAYFNSNVPSIGQSLFNLVNVPGNRHKQNILLTGATGFLGIHILKELLASDQGFVYCIVRGESNYQAESRLKCVFEQYYGDLSSYDCNRIIVLSGNLIDAKFDLPSSKYEQLTDEIDVIIHAAADTNLLKNYDRLCRTNVLSTANIIEFARKRKLKAVHYVSTLAVSGYLPNGMHSQFSENDFNCNQLFMSSYEETKFDAEKLIREFFKGGGEGRIYRSGHIAAESASAQFQSNIQQNRVFQIINGIILLKKIPVTYRESVAFSYVDIVSKAIVDLCLNKINSPMKCLHLENPQNISFLKLVQMLNQMGYEIEIVDMVRFNEAVANFRGSQIEKEGVDVACLWINRSINYPRQIRYLQHSTIDTIAKSGLYFPLANFRWFSTMISKGINAGFFSDPLAKAKVVCS
ncbi:thioester reductase-like protein [Pedobacter psychrotolerans]|uniref:Thioester reductase-like protein n=1 Tax=Pedobacter psychrotolerans TaxID=1843235 RepID=A0A4R2H810_9SPHI|nr:SDR family oxidoreductase [Pedobacter psychrotolerans]TCO22686.1 thioester reductase-like protein [Pedobacter psychrotolerans]GGE66383.1 hypothetical protein GCM10011413_36160 [Pedobacter psychrotolerans]